MERFKLITPIKDKKKKFRGIVLSAFGNIEFSSRAFYLCLTLILVVVAGLLEDFDSYELIPFYLGMLLYELHTILNRQ